MSKATSADRPDDAQCWPCRWNWRDFFDEDREASWCYIHGTRMVGCTSRRVVMCDVAANPPASQATREPRYAAQSGIGWWGVQSEVERRRIAMCTNEQDARKIVAALNAANE